MKLRFRSAFLFFSMLCFAGCSLFQTGNQESLQNANSANNETAESQVKQGPGPEDNVEEPDPVTPDGIYIIFDDSNSMWGMLKGGQRKIDVAKNVLSDFVGEDFSGYHLAMRAYGHRRKSDCKDTEYAVPFGDPSKNAEPMRAFVKDLKPLGMTPITFSLQESLKDFGDRAGEIILISDGVESCDADPCALIREWKTRNVKIKVHVVGFGLDEKSKSVLKCISEASGTEYYDAQSSEALADALRKIREKAATKGFILRGRDPAGGKILVTGELVKDGKVEYKVSSNGRFQVDEGQYELRAGVKTINGNIYKPVTKTVNVKGTGETVVEVTVPLPPRVKAKFVDSENERQVGSLVSVYDGNKLAGKFRAKDEVFIDEGSYEFRSTLKAVGDVSVNESFKARDRKEVLFRIARAVNVLIKIKAKGSGEVVGGNPELWQDGKLMYKINKSSGRTVLPGTYELRLEDDLTPFRKSNVVISTNARQEFEFEVPVGFVTFVYRKSNGARDKSDRVFVGPSSGNKRKYKNSDQAVPIVAGRYTVEGWKQKGNYDPVTFDVRAGERKEVVLRAK